MQHAAIVPVTMSLSRRRCSSSEVAGMTEGALRHDAEMEIERHQVPGSCPRAGDLRQQRGADLRRRRQRTTREGVAAATDPACSRLLHVIGMIFPFPYWRVLIARHRPAERLRRPLGGRPSAASAVSSCSRSIAIFTPARSRANIITERESRTAHPRAITSVISSRVMLTKRIGMPISRPGAVASETPEGALADRLTSIEGGAEAECAPLSLATLKRVVREGLTLRLATGTRPGTPSPRSPSAPIGRKVLAAFLEKRPPRFTDC